VENVEGRFIISKIKGNNLGDFKLTRVANSVMKSVEELPYSLEALEGWLVSSELNSPRVTGAVNRNVKRRPLGTRTPPNI
jgi:hypothetical protein